MTATDVPSAVPTASASPGAALPPEAILGRVMLAFRGLTVPDWVSDRLRSAPAAGFTLFRDHNVDSAEQILSLTSALQATAPPGLPLLLAADQEGGQLVGLGDATTAFPGNMALGAVADPALAERVGDAIGRELRALGVNVDYAPVCDVASNPASPGLGIRSFGSDPAAVAGLVAAFVRGLQSQGVAATGKHFPGKGGLGLDSHHRLGVVQQDRDAFGALELVPFQAAIASELAMVMSGHFAAPALTGSDDLPATLSPRVMSGLLRDRLGFGGVTITDALDMKALSQGSDRVIDAVAALRAGVDLLLCAADRDAIEQLEHGLVLAARRGLFDDGSLVESAERIAALRRWLASRPGPRPDLTVLRSAEHVALAREVAARALTLVRDDASLLPLRLGADARVAAVMPKPADLTPADTSSRVVPGLAPALRRHISAVDELLVPTVPAPDDIAAIVEATLRHEVVVLGTIGASFVPQQADLARALLAAHPRVVTVALRTPWDLATYAESRTHMCTYSILQESLDALADALLGHASFPGTLPVRAEDVTGVERRA